MSTNESHTAHPESAASIEAAGLAGGQGGAQPQYLVAAVPPLHPCTLDLVERFAHALAEKLYAAEMKYGYSDGWLRNDWMDECRAKLVEHVAKGDPRDVAAYSAFLWHHGERTALPAHPESAARQEAEPSHDEKVASTIWKSRYFERRNVIAEWHAKATALGYDGVEELLAMALPCIVTSGGDERAAPQPARQEAVAWEVRTRKHGEVWGPWRQTSQQAYGAGAPGHSGSSMDVEYRALYTAPQPAPAAPAQNKTTCIYCGGPATDSLCNFDCLHSRPMKVTPDEIVEYRKEQGNGFSTAVGEYTPDAFWDALDEIERLRAIIATPTGGEAEARDAELHEAHALIKELGEAQREILKQRDEFHRDTVRLDYMASALMREAQIKLPDGVRDCWAWAISSANPDLRAAIDAAIASSGGKEKGNE